MRKSIRKMRMKNKHHWKMQQSIRILVSKHLLNRDNQHATNQTHKENPKHTLSKALSYLTHRVLRMASSPTSLKRKD